MSIEDIVNYVNETPHNTNISVLRSKLKVYGEEITKGTVKSVNEILPDEQGNVQFTYDDLAGKPFGDDEGWHPLINITEWNPSEYGNITNIPSIDDGVTWLREFDSEAGSYDTPMYAVLHGDFGELTINSVWSETIASGSPSAYISNYDLGIAFSLRSSGAGYYAIKIQDAHTYEGTITDFQIFVYGTKSIKLDPKFLPYSASTEDIEAGVTPLETGTFYFVYE